MEDILRSKLWAVGGGKGGVGKSIVTLLLGVRLARLGSKVILVDADLGGANLNILLGVRYPLHTLEDFINRRVDRLENALTSTPIENLRLLCGADDILGIANPKFTQKKRILDQLKHLDADIILLDLGAGTSFTTMDFFLYAGGKIVVLSPQVTSIQNAYGFIKSCLHRNLVRTFSKDTEALTLIKSVISDEEKKIESISELRKSLLSLGQEREPLLSSCFNDMKPGIVVNMIRNEKERNVAKVIHDVSEKYLDISPEYLGFVHYDPILDKSINQMESFLTTGKSNTANMQVYDIAMKILKRMKKESIPKQPSVVQIHRSTKEMFNKGKAVSNSLP